MSLHVQGWRKERVRFSQTRGVNRHLRRALHMPAWVGLRFDLHFNAFYRSLLDWRKRKLQALKAVARKLLHAVYGVFKTEALFDAAKLLLTLKLA